MAIVHLSGQESDREGSPTPRQSPEPELVVPAPVSHRLTTPDTDRLRPSAPPASASAVLGAAKQTLAPSGVTGAGVEGSPSASALTSTSDQRSFDADDDYGKDLVRCLSFLFLFRDILSPSSGPPRALNFQNAFNLLSTLANYTCMFG